MAVLRIGGSDIVLDMKTISVSVSEGDYEAFRQAAKESDRSIAQLIREAMARFRASELEARTALRDVPVLPGHRPLGPLPDRSELYDEIFAAKDVSTGSGS